MPNQITAAGIEVKTRDELIAEFTAAMQAIYGADINLDSSSPDGQMMNIYVQAYIDLQDLLVQIYNGFDPDNAIGNTLDERVAINGIVRKGGTYSTTNVTLVLSQSLNLYGLDQTSQPVFTVSDNAGNKWELVTSASPSGAGTYVYAFRAAVPGAVLTIPNTITVPVTIVLGVTSINNPTTYTTLGINEETDAALKIRRQKSVSLASQGYLAGLLAALENIDGVTSAFVFENDTDTVDTNGVPGHSIWVIVAGSALPQDIANAIYTKRNAGCGLFGAESYVITQVDGTFFTVLWDDVTPETLFIKFTATSLDGVTPPNIATIRAGLVVSFAPGVNEQVNINDLATAVQEIDNNTLVTNAGFSLSSAGPFVNVLSPSVRNKQFAVSAPDIIIIPMILNPTSSHVASLAMVAFSSLGGFGTLTYSLDSNPSGATINSATGVYTAGAGTGTDVARVTDSLGNFATATVVVS